MPLYMYLVKSLRVFEPWFTPHEAGDKITQKFEILVSKRVVGATHDFSTAFRFRIISIYFLTWEIP